MHYRNSGVLTLILLLSVFFVAPFFDYFSVVTDSRLSLLSRGLLSFAVILLSIPIIFSRESNFKGLMLLYVPVISCIIWYMLDEYSSDVFFENFAFLVKSIVLFSFYLVFVRLDYSSSNMILTCAKFSLVVYMAAIIFGATFDIEYMRSYEDSERLGYKGIIIAQNEGSGLVLVSLLLSSMTFVDRSYKYIDLILFLLSSCAALLMGTKAAFFMPVIVLCFVYISRYGLYRSAVPMLFVLLCFFFLLILFKTFHGSADDLFDSVSGYFQYQYEYYAGGNLLTFLLSGRDYKLKFAFENMILVNPSYIIFGGFPMGQYSVEIDFIDLFFLLGAPLFVVYVIYLYKILVYSEGKLVLARFGLMSLLICFLVANTSGHFFTSALIAPYLGLFCARLRIGCMYER